MLVSQILLHHHTSVNYKHIALRHRGGRSRREKNATTKERMTQREKRKYTG